MDALAPCCERTDWRLSPEAQFIASTSLTQRKKRGQFFTPSAYGDIMVDWIAAKSPGSVMDPAIGPGLLIHACQKRGVGRTFDGFDIDPLALELAERRLAATKLHHQDFLSADGEKRFDAIIANPPYLNHRDHNLDPAIAESIAKRTPNGLSGQSNLFVYFVVKICEQIAQGGRAAILIPAEWMSANYGQPLKSYLLDNNLLKGLVTMDHADQAFADNMATASILLIERHTEPIKSVKSYFVPAGVTQSSLTAMEEEDVIVRQSLPPDLLRARKKWDALLRQVTVPPAPGRIKLGDLVTTKRGIATGANRFFLLSQKEAEIQNLDIARMDRCVGKTAQVEAMQFTDSDFDRLVADGQACFLFNPKGDLTSSEAAYIAQGERLGIPLKHGPRTKKVWYAAEARQPAPIWASTFGRGHMRFVHNDAGINTLTCFHSLYPKNLDPIQVRALVILLNSDILQGTVAAHVRRYTSGLMKLEPRDILEIPVPDIRLLPKAMVLQLASELDNIRTDKGRYDQSALNRLAAAAFAFFGDPQTG